MIKPKSTGQYTQCGDIIASTAPFKGEINGFVVCGDCKIKVRVHQNDWLIELAKEINCVSS